MDYPPARMAAPRKSVTIASTTAKEADVTLTQALGVRRGDRDVVALQVANTMLSGEGTGSMLFRDVRSTHGYVYSIDSALDVGETDSTFALTFASDPKDVERAQKLAAAAIERLRTSPPSEADVAPAKAMLLASYTVSLDSYDSVASQLLESTEMGLDAGDLNRYYTQVIATSPQDVMRAMRRWIDPAHFTRVVIAPSQ
jgi:zinc protease